MNYHQKQEVRLDMLNLLKRFVNNKASKVDIFDYINSLLPFERSYARDTINDIDNKRFKDIFFSHPHFA